MWKLLKRFKEWNAQSAKEQAKHQYAIALSSVTSYSPEDIVLLLDKMEDVMKVASAYAVRPLDILKVDLKRLGNEQG